eukprot:TRINITY_DN1291_c0_g1_i4.p1 TRINITY_DN1291_c0_g1~~TRINITY_DN1291_c0_g1_i4.p1  ORF type:complete len:269 (+),score=52.17 TRINITY_DN1291_c0_g1_i4:351-1157(+)
MASLVSLAACVLVFFTAHWEQQDSQGEEDVPEAEQSQPGCGEVLKVLKDRGWALCYYTACWTGPLWMLTALQHVFGFTKQAPTCESRKFWQPEGDQQDGTEMFLVSFVCFAVVVAVIVWLEYVRHRFQYVTHPEYANSQQGRTRFSAWAAVHDQMTMSKLMYINSNLWTQWVALAASTWIQVAPLQYALVTTIVAFVAAEQLPVVQLAIEAKIASAYDSMVDRRSSGHIDTGFVAQMKSDRRMSAPVLQSSELCEQTEREAGRHSTLF